MSKTYEKYDPEHEKSKVFARAKERGVTPRIDYVVMAASKSTGRTRHLLQVLVDHCNRKKGWAEPGEKLLAWLLNCNPRTVRRHLLKLEAREEIVVVRRPNRPSRVAFVAWELFLVSKEDSPLSQPRAGSGRTAGLAVGTTENNGGDSGTHKEDTPLSAEPKEPKEPVWEPRKAAHTGLASPPSGTEKRSAPDRPSGGSSGTAIDESATTLGTSLPSGSTGPKGGTGRVAPSRLGGSGKVVPSGPALTEVLAYDREKFASYLATDPKQTAARRFALHCDRKGWDSEWQARLALWHDEDDRKKAPAAPAAKVAEGPTFLPRWQVSHLSRWVLRPDKVLYRTNYGRLVVSDFERVEKTNKVVDGRKEHQRPRGPEMNKMIEVQLSDTKAYVVPLWTVGDRYQFSSARFSKAS